MDDVISKLHNTSHSLMDIAYGLQSPESLPVLATADSSIEVARKTLRFLRNLNDTEQDMEEWMYIGALTEQQTKADYLHSLISIYAAQVKIAQLSNPDLLTHFTIDHANHAAGSIALSIAMHTLENLPENDPLIAPLEKKLDGALPEWENRQTQSVERLIDALESGLTHLAGKPVGDRSPVDRLLEVSANLQEAVRQLYTIDEMEEGAREESVELAREILRKLKNLSFSDKPIEESIDTGRPNEKLALAQRISGMVDMYKNLLFDAMRVNPEIIHDIRVKNANDAAGWVSNGVALMAAKEIPSNSTAINQISVDMAEMKAAGKNMHGLAINHLMHKMEGGLEHAAEHLNSREKGEHREHTEAQAEALAERLRRQRRRRQQQKAARAAAGGGSHSNVNRGNMARQHEQVKAILRDEAKVSVGLNKMDIAAVRQAGNSLRKSNKQANDMISLNVKMDKTTGVLAPAATVTANSKITPDDRGFATRERDPLNPNHPRNRPRLG